MDKKFLAFEAKYKISDVIFKQHMETQFKLNVVIIFTQLLLLIISVVLQFYKIYIASIVCGINIVLCFLVMINNFVNCKAWEKAKKRQVEEIDCIVDVLCKEDLEPNDIVKALGLKVPQSELEEEIKNETKVYDE